MDEKTKNSEPPEPRPAGAPVTPFQQASGTTKLKTKERPQSDQTGPRPGY